MGLKRKRLKQRGFYFDLHTNKILKILSSFPRRTMCVFPNSHNSNIKIGCNNFKNPTIKHTATKIIRLITYQSNYDKKASSGCWSIALDSIHHIESGNRIIVLIQKYTEL